MPFLVLLFKLIQGNESFFIYRCPKNIQVGMKLHIRSIETTQELIINKYLLILIMFHGWPIERGMEQLSYTFAGNGV